MTDVHGGTLSAPALGEDWYRDWQSDRHAVSFDVRAHLDARNLLRNFERFNDVRLLRQRLEPLHPLTLLEVGCATGEFYRYLRRRYPLVRYVGVDISRPAIERARQKYPEGAFVVTAPEVPLAEVVQAAGLPAPPEVVYAKDVVHHQVRPYEFLEELIALAADAVVIRTRTRDRGATELDPERSCQHHYGGWMPFIVFNLEELLERIRAAAPQSEIVVWRHHMVLGGRYHRFVPKELYLEDTGTAETAVGVFKRASRAGRVAVVDRPDEQPAYTWDYRLRHALRRAAEAWRGGDDGRS